MLSGQAYVLGSSHGSAGWKVRGREEPGYQEGMQDSPTLSMIDKAGLGEETGPFQPHPTQKKDPQDLRPVPCVSVGLSDVCVLGRERGVRGLSS